LPKGAEALPFGAANLPFVSVGFTAIRVLASAPEAIVAGGRVLVIEDDESTLRALQRLLEAAGLLSAGFESAEQLLASDAYKDAVCVVSDLILPGMSGLELLAALRSRDVKSPFILITANDSLSVRAEATARGGLYLAKPVLGDELLDAIEEATAIPP
jgi:FixJ family two-component response regulator